MRAIDTRRSSGRLGAAALALAALCGVGCSSGPPELTLEVTSAEGTNGGRPFYAVIRSVEQATYITDSYEAISAKVFANPPDPSVLRTEVIYPGVPATWTIEQPEGLSVGVYFLFTEPGDGWKIIRSPPLPTVVEVDLGANDRLSAE